MDRRRFLALSGLVTIGAAPGPPTIEARPTWKRDGAGLRARIGVLTPDFDPVPESELSALAPPGVSIHASRVVRARTPAAFAEPPHVDAAAERLADLAPHAIVFAYTGSSYALGPDADDPTRRRLEERAHGVPVILTCPAATTALRAFGAKRIAIINPPWFSAETSDLGRAYFTREGFDVVRCTRIDPFRSFTEVRPQEVFEWVGRNVPTQSDAVFIGGNGLRAIGTIDALEAALRKPVLTANQVAFWAALRAARVTIDIHDYGRIFKLPY
jgi:maleate isomerase